MSETINFESFPVPNTSPGASDATPPKRTLSAQHEAIGQVVDIGGSGARIEIVARRLNELAEDPDPSVAMSGQVGSQIKIASGRRWLLANVRSLKVSDAEAGFVVAEIDFLGEGDEDPSSGRLVNFKRGITAYPIPGSRAYPVTGADLKQMFAAD